MTPAGLGCSQVYCVAPTVKARSTGAGYQPIALLGSRSMGITTVLGTDCGPNRPLGAGKTQHPIPHDGGTGLGRSRR